VLSLIIRFVINAAALWLAAQWVRGIDIEGWQSLLLAAVIFGLINALIKPVAQLIGCPLTCLTFGLFALVALGGAGACCVYPFATDLEQYSQYQTYCQHNLGYVEVCFHFIRPLTFSSAVPALAAGWRGPW
jgi:hypothetical protein